MSEVHAGSDLVVESFFAVTSAASGKNGDNSQKARGPAPSFFGAYLHVS
jgi:hypothetical protein